MIDSRAECRVELGSMTLALKAQKILGAAAIPSTVIKLSAEGRGRGCSYGLRFSCAQRRNLFSLLENERIRVREIEWKDGS